MCVKESSTMTLVLFVFVSQILFCVSNPIPETGVYSMMLKTVNDTKYKCENLRLTPFLTASSNLMKRCIDYTEAINAKTFNHANEMDAFCLLYFNSFLQLCLTSNNVSKIILDEKLNNETFEKPLPTANTSEVCHEFHKIKPGIVNSNGINETLKLFKSKRCDTLCEETPLLICRLSAYMLQVDTEFQKLLKDELSSPTVAQKATNSNDNLKHPDEISPKNEIASSTQKIQSINSETVNSNVHRHSFLSMQSNIKGLKPDLNIPINKNSADSVIPKNDETKPILQKSLENNANVDIKAVEIKNEPAKKENKNNEPSQIDKQETTLAVQTSKPSPPPMPANEMSPPLLEDKITIDKSDEQNGKMYDETPEDEEEAEYKLEEKESKKLPMTGKKPSTLGEDIDTNSVSYNTEEVEGESYFFSYFMTICILFVLCYVGYHNKQKILALVLEGRKGRRAPRGRRPNSANYHKLDCNLEEAVTSSCNKNTTQVIY